MLNGKAGSECKGLELCDGYIGSNWNKCSRWSSIYICTSRDGTYTVHDRQLAQVWPIRDSCCCSGPVRSVRAEGSANSVCGFFGPVCSLPPGFLCQVAAGLAAGLTPENLREVIKVQSHKPTPRKLNIDGLLHKRGKERKVVRSITSLLKNKHASITHRLNPSSSCPPSQPSSPPRSQSPPPSSPYPPTPSSNPQPCP